MRQLACSALMLLLVSAPASAGLTATERASFVGCKADGQVGPLKAPASGAAPLLPAPVARRLAYYRAPDGPGVLAPRGWHCFGLYGSNGSILVVTPQQHISADFFGKRLFSTSESAVVLIYRDGGTSGRWAVAEAIARYFPEHRNFIRTNFQGLEIGPLPAGPYPQDRIIRRTSALVRFVTPPYRKGEGTSGYLSPNADPVDGIVKLIADPDGPELIEANVRIRRAPTALVSAILRQAQLEAGR